LACDSSRWLRRVRIADLPAAAVRQARAACAVRESAHAGWILPGSTGTDCNDSNNSIFPGAPETCANEGIDNDCDGNASEASDRPTWYQDVDGDQYGDIYAAVVACNPPGSGWTRVAGDGCPTDPLKRVPGICGCGVADADTDADTVANCIDNCPTVPNPDQLDCNGDGYGLACSTTADCNGNGVPDSCQVDCNKNGAPDDWEIAQGTIGDCNDNNVPDDCEDGYINADTGDMGPVGTGRPVVGTLTGQTPSSAPVAVRVQCRGDLDGTPEFLLLTLNGVAVGGELFRFDGTECPEIPDLTEVTLTPSRWIQVLEAATTPGEVRVRIVASAAVSENQCAGGTTRVTISYAGPDYDCDGNGQPDSCQLDAEDCNGNGILDACETGGPGDSDGDGRPDSCERAYGDFDLNGVIGGADISVVLAAWGVANAQVGDLNGDGTVDGNDLTVILARWGPVP
jgi:hypothetical protein